MAEKATRELEKMQLQEKADVKYKEWLKKKRAEEAEKKKKEKVLTNWSFIWMEVLNLYSTYTEYIDIKWQCCTWKNLSRVAMLVH